MSQLFLWKPKIVGTFSLKKTCLLCDTLWYLWRWLHNKRIGTTNVVSCVQLFLLRKKKEFSDKNQRHPKKINEDIKKSIAIQFCFPIRETGNYQFMYCNLFALWFYFFRSFFKKWGHYVQNEKLFNKWFNCVV